MPPCQVDWRAHGHGRASVLTSGMYVCMYNIYIYIYIYTYIYTYTYVNMSLNATLSSRLVCAWSRTCLCAHLQYACMYACMYVCMYVYV